MDNLSSFFPAIAVVIVLPQNACQQTVSDYLLAVLKCSLLVWYFLSCYAFPILFPNTWKELYCTKLENDYQVKESLLPKSELIHQHHTCNAACCIITERRPELMINCGRRQKISPRSQTECRVIHQVWSMGFLHLSAAVSCQIHSSQLCNNLLLCF